MKLPALLLAGSLAANAVLVATFVARPALAPAAWQGWFESAAAREIRVAAVAADTAARSEKAAAAALTQAAAAQAKLWSTLATDDLKDLVARLRAAGFPASVIRSIVSARIEAAIAGRLQALTQAVHHTPYWQPSSANSLRNPKYFEERAQIFRDRAKLLREALGDLGAGEESDAARGLRRDFGDLPASKVDALRRINDDYAEMMSEVRAASQGILLPEDRAKLALLEREKRADLAALLNPAELADYEMRSSILTQRLRQAMTLMNATESEFRAIYQAQLPFRDLVAPAPGMSAGNIDFEARRQATRTMNEQIAAALGPARALEFQRASNYEYQQLATLAQRQNLPPNAAAEAFDLRQQTSLASDRIARDQTLSNAQKHAALKTLAERTRSQLASTLGPAGSSYIQSATWLNAIERGTSVTFDGTTTMFRSLPPPSTPPATPVTPPTP